MDGLPKGLLGCSFELRLGLPLLVTGYDDTTTHHVHHRVHHRIFSCYVHCFIFNLIVFWFTFNKKTSAVCRGSIVYFKNLKLCNSELCGSFLHDATHMAHCKFHFLNFLLEQTSELFFNWPNIIWKFNIWDLLIYI